MSEGRGGERSDGGPRGSGHATALQIARTAYRLFAERGFDATPVRAIADEAGVSCPTLYYHFGNKEGLAQGLLIRPLTALVESVRGLVGDDRLDPVDRLERLIDRQLDFSREDPCRARFVYAVMFGPSDRSLASEVDRLILELKALDREAAERLAGANLMRPDRVDDLVSALRGQVVIRTMDFLYRGAALGPELPGRIVDDLLLGHAEPGARGLIAGRHRPPGVEPPRS